MFEGKQSSESVYKKLASLIFCYTHTEAVDVNEILKS